MASLVSGGNDPLHTSSDAVENHEGHSPESTHARHQAHMRQEGQEPREQQSRPLARPQKEVVGGERVSTKRTKLPLIIGAAVAAVVAVLAVVFVFVFPISFGESPEEETLVDTTPQKPEDGFVAFEEAAAAVPQAENAVEAIDVSGESQSVEGAGVNVTVQPLDLALVKGQPFAIKFTLEINDAINPDIKEITVPRLTQYLQDNLGVANADEFRFNEDAVQVSGDMTMRTWPDEIELMGFKAGDKVEFTTYGACPDSVEVMESMPVELDVYGDSREMYSDNQFIGYADRSALATMTLNLSVA